MNTLFIVDDDIIFQRIIKMNLIKYPAFKRVYYYTEGKTMLASLTENKNDFSNLPDAIFLDITMPLLDGWGVLDAIEKLYNSLCKKIVVYVVTASIMERDKERALAYGFVHEFISKPLYGTKLMEIYKDFKISALYGN